MVAPRRSASAIGRASGTGGYPKCKLAGEATTCCYFHRCGFGGGCVFWGVSPSGET
jgi:hypothetical protein